MKYQWMYSLNPGIQLLTDSRGPLLFSTIPLAIFRLNEIGFKLLKDCEAGLTAAEITKKNSRIQPEKIIQFLESFVDKGLLNKSYSIPQETLHVPSVSVVIPVRNRPQQIKRCIESILQCNYPQEKLEIIVVDDYSTDGETVEMIKRFPVTLIEMDRNVGQSACRNVGVKGAKGEIIAFTDSDCVVSENWLQILTSPFIDKNIAVVGGGVKSYGTKLLDRYEEICSPLHMGDRGGKISPKGYIKYVPTCNVLIRKEAFQAVGGFNEAYTVGEDVDLLWRIFNKGYEGWYIPEGDIFHDHRTDLMPFLKRRAQYASSEAMLEKNFDFNRKKMFFSFWNMANLILFICFFLVFIMSNNFLTFFVLLICLALTFGIELLLKQKKLRAINCDLTLSLLCPSLFRSHLAFLGQFTAAITRYYSLALLCLGLFIHELLLLTLLIIGLSSYFKYSLKTNNIHFIYFTFIYMFEMFAYQCGIVYGCLKERNGTPMAHKVKLIS